MEAGTMTNPPTTWVFLFPCCLPPPTPLTTSALMQCRCARLHPFSSRASLCLTCLRTYCGDLSAQWSINLLYDMYYAIGNGKTKCDRQCCLMERQSRITKCGGLRPYFGTPSPHSNPSPSPTHPPWSTRTWIQHRWKETWVEIFWVDFN